MERKKYYDANPWYLREKTQDWYQQMEITNQEMRGCLAKLVNQQSHVTEVACGGGWLAEYIATLGPNSYGGFDFSEAAVANAARRLAGRPNFRCSQGDALSQEMYSEDTNLLLAHQFLHCLIGEDRARWMRICRDVLAHRAGTFLLSSMIGLPPSVKDTVDQSTRINRPGNRYYAEDEEIQGELRSAGFKIEEILYPEPHVAIYRACTQRSP